ncbi:hypothetical protein IOD16_26780 [Saccharothrix sp. 6-C]|uniref:hypothetical protein n=1 Tax=Saccharothrix sp. 6-C TaxID=2781735 RepID=UPI0019174D33|nr:hypothetical protein [Saccharothrix sp. 6-C]QQQ74728.1 hypothetical protein IOD16_26780 [Saccharothrix sp. 6-C]
MSRRLLGAVLLVAAGVVAVVGTFLPLYQEGNDQAGGSLTVTATSWDFVFSNLPAGMDLGPVQSPQYGVPIVVAAVLLAVAVALAFLPEHQRLAARYLAVGGTGLLTGAVWATGASVASAVGNASRQPDDSYTVEVGAGIVLLVAAVLVAVVGVVLLHARRPEPRPGGAVVYRVDGSDDDTDTPPFGIPVVDVAQLPDSEFDRRAEGS